MRPTGSAALRPTGRTGVWPAGPGALWTTGAAALWLPSGATRGSRPPATPGVSRIPALSGARTEPRRLFPVQVLRAVVADVLPAVGGRVSAGGLAGGAFGASCSARLLAPLFVEGFLGDAEGVYRGGHAAVENHLGDDFGDFLLADSDVQGARDVPLDHLRAVAQHHQRGDGAQAAGAQVNGGTVVNLAVDNLVDQLHHVRSQLHHGRGRLRVVVRAVVEHPEFGGGLFQVYLYFYFELLVILHQVAVSGFRVIRDRRLIGTQVWVFVIVFGGHGVHLAGVSPPP